MSNKYFRCGSGLDQCPHSQSGKAFAVSEDDWLIWTCPHSIHCKSNLIELTWSQANPWLYRSLIGVIVLMVLGALSWMFWPDLLLRECKDYRSAASKFASEVDESLAQSNAPKWNAAEWEARVNLVAPLDSINDTDNKESLNTMRQTLAAIGRDIQAHAKSNDPNMSIDPSKGLELLTSGNKLKTRAVQKKHQTGINEVSSGLEAVTAALGRLQSSGSPSNPEGLPELLSLIGGRDTKIENQLKAIEGRIREKEDSQRTAEKRKIQEIEDKQREEEERLVAIRSSTVSMRVSSTPGIADSLMVPLAKAFVASTQNDKVQILTDGEVRRVYWTDKGGDTQQIEIFEQVDDVGFASLGQSNPAKRSDVHVAFRGPSSAESAALAGVGNLLSSDCAQVIALDAVSVLVNAGNSITNLVEGQLDDLISEKIVNWAGVGGQDRPVTMVLPLPTGRESIVASSFKQRLAGTDTKQSERLVDDSMGQDAGSLGLAAYSTCKRSKALGIQAAERTRVLMPSPFTIATEDYKYTVRVIAHHAVKASKTTTEFMRYAIGTEGQKAVGACGYVDLNVKVNSEENDEIIAAIAKRVSPKRLRDAERLSTNLRFETGKSDLDIKAQADIRRVVQRLADPDLRDRRLAVLGFADARGGDVVNLPLSESRAATVADIFISLGIKPSAQMGFGARMPVDTNDTDVGMQRNRRVELWILRFQEGN
jgi:outer membrane protein OmpA-like peptidoglycan-associated protein